MLKYFQKSKKEETGKADEPLDETAQKRHEAEEEKISALEYHPEQEQRPTSSGEDPSQPVLSDADELFLLQVASEGEPPPLPPRPNSSGSISSASAAKEAAAVPITDHDTLEASKEAAIDAERPTSPASQQTWQARMHDIFTNPQPDLALQRLRQMTADRQAANLQRQRSKDRQSAAATLKAAVDEGRNRSSSPSPTRASTESATERDIKKEAQSEQKEVSNILDRLNLSSINNRVVGVSHDTQKLLERFNQVLKDIVNGVPTAYDDLEKLLTERQGQLDKLYGTLPSWIQSLVKVVPVKVYAALAPQVAAAMQADDKRKAEEAADEKDGKKKKKRSYVPSLKSLVGQKGAVAGMLRSIIGFLEARFPALLAGTNIIVSLAVFILLFVFWYCHKRGKETRLAREAADAEAAGYSSGDNDSLTELEKSVDLEKSQRLGEEDEPPREVKALPAVDDADIEQNVDNLMEQLGQPTDKAAQHA